MKALITGARGFIARNLAVHLRERDVEVLELTRDSPAGTLGAMLASADFVFHLAGVNRPTDPAEFITGNVDLTRELADALAALGRPVPVAFASSTRAEVAGPYGDSKRRAEEILLASGTACGSPVYLYRLPNVFGKWSQPNYNSVVATFCHNIARDLPVSIHDPGAQVRLVYVDDVVREFVGLLEGARAPRRPFDQVEPVYQATVGELAEMIRAFRNVRGSLLSERVGFGLTRALYATYVSHLPTSAFAYAVPAYTDPRGTFVEILKTRDSGQFSYFTARAGVTRGGHYHHTKTEKFLVLRGRALFRFRHLVTGEYLELTTSDEKPEIVETVPGWTHDITNVGTEEMIVMLWANEIFDRARPDTIARALTQ